MKTLIAALTSLIAFAPTGAAAESTPAIWSPGSVVVQDFLPADAGRDLAAVVYDFNAHRPPSAPELIYTAADRRTCEDLTQQPGVIQVCLSSLVPTNATAWSPRTIDQGFFVSGQVAIRDSAQIDDWRVILCHEMMHAVGDAPDDFSRPHPDDSCVQGFLNHLGSWDIAWLQQVYQPSPIDHHRKHHRKHHRH
jgi:hypothetical protein